MKFSKSFISTTKEAPSDAVLSSHIYLSRGGFVTQVAAGVYNFLPLGKIVLDKITDIVNEELTKSGAQEVKLGFVTPASLWQESGRLEKFGKELLRFKDRKNNDFLLGPTHEEMMVNIVRNRITSYKQLPLNLYQIGLKFRDEARPRFGLMRGREFVMKDGYSFHASVEDMKREFALMQETYERILRRLGLDFRVVEADSGAIGGSGSRELMVLADSGEDTIVVCSSCEYGANIEASVRKAKDTQTKESKEFTKVHTPNVTSIKDVSSFLNVSPEVTLKAVVKRAIFADSDEIVIFFLRGTDELQEVKAANSVGATEIVDVGEDELKDAGIVAGFIAPMDQNVKCIFDNELKDERALVCGANEVDYHYTGFNIQTLENVEFSDLVSVGDGDSCTYCGSELHHTKGIEVGHIFQLGTTYSKPLGATFLDENGKSAPMEMGTYGIGISRLVAAVIEQNHDDKGCIWTPATTPYCVNVLISNIKDEEQRDFGMKLYEALQKNGIETIVDDRAERFGFKIKDAELLGFSYTVIIGKGLKDGKIEILKREGLIKIELSSQNALEDILEIIQ